jgi:shikimate dehydrogenase
MIITASTRLCGSLGHWPPGRQTTSPVMLNAAFAELDLDYRWFVFQPESIGAAMAAIRTLNFAGVSVTKPFKEEIIAHLDELDPVAASIGAVNLVRNDGGRLTGYNCDWIGAAGALAEVCELAGQRVAVLGSGGAARAVVYGLVQSKCDVHVFSRSEPKGRALADSLGASYGGQLGDVPAAGPGILVNATSIGNDLQADVPVPDDVFATARIVMDVVTRAGRSALLERATSAGAQTIGGVRMLVLQGAFAFETLTGRPAPVAVMQQAVERALGA